MAVEMDKFVLQYTVDSGKAEKDLDKLNKKIEQVTKNGSEKGKLGKGLSDGLDKATGKAKQFADGIKDVAGELKGVDTSIGGFVGNIGRLPPAVAAVTAGIALMTAGLMAANKQAENLNKQLALGFKTGTSSLRIEMFERGMISASGGKVGREESRGGIERIHDIVKAAYMDPTQMGDASQRLRRVGVNAFDQNGQMKNPMDAQMEISKSLAAMSKEQAAAMGALLDLSPNYVQALRIMNGEMAKAAKMTELEAQQHQQASLAAIELQAAWSRVNQSMHNMGETVGDYFLPIVKEGAELVASASEGLQKGLRGTSRALTTAGSFIGGWASEIVSTFDKIFSGEIIRPDKIATEFVDGFTRAQAFAAEKWKEGGVEVTKKTADASEADNKARLKITAQEEKNMQAFAASVAAFSNTIDERQAWAAWAGEVGRGVLSGPASIASPAGTDKGGPGRSVQNREAALAATAGYGSNGQPTTGTNIAPIKGMDKYDAIIKAKAAKYGVDENLIKRVINIESQGKSSAVSEVGAVGLMQLMPQISKKYGITNAFDPEQNIEGGTRLLAENLKAENGDVVRALLRYHGGTNEANWGPKTQAYPGKVLGAGISQPANTSGSNPSANTYWSAREKDAQNPNAIPTYTFEGGKNLAGGGEGKAQINLAAVQAALASQLHVPVTQLQQGQVNKGDVSWVASNMITELDNKAKALVQQFKAPGNTPQQIGQLQIQARDLIAERNRMNDYAGSIIDKSREGGRQMTLGSSRIDINMNNTFNNSGNPEKVIDQLRQASRMGVADALNAFNDGRKI